MSRRRKWFGIGIAIVVLALGICGGMYAKRAFFAIRESLGGEARQEYLRTVSRSHLMAIGVAEMEYTYKNDEHVADSLELLVNEGLLQKDEIVSPITGRRYTLDV